MNINPLDILLIVFLIITALLGCRNGIIIEFKKTVSLTSSLILSNIIIKQLADKFYFLKSGTDIFYLTTFLVIFVLIILAVSFIIDMIIEESEEFMIDYYANLGIGALLGAIRGMLLIALILFIFDTTPIDNESKNTFYSKINSKSILFEKFVDFRNIILKK